MKIEIVWREIRTKTFTGSEEKCKEWMAKLCKSLVSNGDNEDIEIFEIGDNDGTIAYFDMNFKRTEMDG